jgi:hypothetical protein
MPPKAQRKPTIAFLAIEHRESLAAFNDIWRGFTRLLEQHARVEYITMPRSAKSVLQRTDHNKPDTVIVADAAFASKTGRPLVPDALEYVQSGGSLLFMGLCPNQTQLDQVEKLFAGFNLAWGRGEYEGASFKLNDTMQHIDIAGLKEHIDQKALHLTGVDIKDAVYKPITGQRYLGSQFTGSAVSQDNTPQAIIKIGAGRLGWMGDVNMENGNVKVILRMCGIVTADTSEMVSRLRDEADAQYKKPEAEESFDFIGDFGVPIDYLLWKD